MPESEIYNWALLSGEPGCVVQFPFYLPDYTGCG